MDQTAGNVSNLTNVMNDSYYFTNEEMELLVYKRQYGVIGLYVPIFFAALFANLIVIIVVIKDHYMRSVTNYFLVNLAVADLLVTLLCMPGAIWNAYKVTFDFGLYSCKIQGYMQGVSVAASIFTITAMAVDRYLAIAKPFDFFCRRFNKKTTYMVIIAMWTTSLILLFPMYLMARIIEQPLPLSPVETISLQICNEDWRNFTLIPRKIMGSIWFIFIFLVPGIIMLVAYSMMGKFLCSVVPPFDIGEMANIRQRNRVVRGRKRVACILLLLAFMFALCWLPYHITILLDDIAISKANPGRAIQSYLLLLGHVNSALNPIIYCALSRKFRTSIKNLFYFKISFSRRNNPQWVDSSGSGTQLNYVHRIKSTPAVQKQFHFAMSRLPSSQKTTRTTVKTCAL